MTAVRLQLASVDLAAEDVAARIAESETLRSLGWKTVSGVTTMTVYTDGDIVNDVTAAIRCATNNGLNVLRVYEDRVTIGAIARRVGNISREAIRKWTLDKTFPAPRSVANSARGTENIYDWAEVARWVVTSRFIPVDTDLPTERQIAAINAFIHGLTDYVSEAIHQQVATPTTPGALKDIHVVYGTLKSAAFTRLTADIAEVSQKIWAYDLGGGPVIRKAHAND